MFVTRNCDKTGAVTGRARSRERPAKLMLGGFAVKMAMKPRPRFTRWNPTTADKAIKRSLDLARSMVRAAAVQILPQSITAGNVATTTMVQPFAAFPKQLPRHDPPPLFIVAARLANMKSSPSARLGERHLFEGSKDGRGFHFRRRDDSVVDGKKRGATNRASVGD